MSGAKRIARIDRLIWILIYLGLAAAVLGWAALRRSAPAGWLLVTAGGLLTAGGIVLVWVRSRLNPSG